MYKKQPLLLLLGLLVMLFSVQTVVAQCDRVGWVAGMVPGCGAKIIDLDNGEILLVTSGGSNLSPGKTITFTSQYVTPPSACAGLGLPAVSLSCVSDVLPCTADFGYAVDNLNPYLFSFNADLYAPGQQTAFWTFGDGSSVSGPHVQHTFSQEGYYDVSLTVSSTNGCSATTTKQVYVSDQNPGWCGYDMQVTAVGTTLQGKLEPLSLWSGNLLSVQWVNSQTSEILGESPILNAELPGYGNYLICCIYQVENPDGTLCTSTRCQQLSVAEPGCVIPQLQHSAAGCNTFLAPVCACNGLTYDNECEAMAAGVTSWWAGDCSSGGFGDCHADFEYEILSGNPDLGYEIRFTNVSSGNYNNTQLDFGDSDPLYESSQWGTKTHFYGKGGIYRVNLTVWKNSSCVSSVTKLIVTDAISMGADMLPNGTDYVLPGDANGDKRANMYDLLDVGVGYSTIGSPRPGANTSWTPQFAPNWSESMTSGVNFKHIDCDGNGTVNEFDPSAIQQNYSPLDTTEVVWNPAAPVVRLDFTQDTIYVDPNNPEPIEISADLMVGTPSKPVFGLYGLALALQYPEYVEHDPATDYYDDSFFGFSNYMLWLPKDNYNRRQLDLGFTRKSGNGASGYGRVANITFRADYIIIIDIVDRAANKTGAFSVPIKGLKAVDPFGNKKELTLPVVTDTVWIKFLPTTGTQESELSKSVSLYPNPTNDLVTVLTRDLKVDRIDILAPLGQTLRSQKTISSDHLHRVLLSDFPDGVYTLRLFSDQA
ncbi:MAG: PKD domain-containing protein [Lewinellaceae bacterium]|nr:PKD domain-containing protein [Lewinellaceae bacterium]